MKITVGADPEIFVFDKKTKKPVSAHKMIPGTKSKPFLVKDGAVQVDGMALEFNIAPASTQQQFTMNIQHVLKQMQGMLPLEVETKVQSSVFFDKDYMSKQPAAALELGCEPDMNAYTREENPSPNAKTTLRTAAGHVHIGWGTGGYDVKSDEHLDSCFLLTKLLDMSLGIWSLQYDDDITRRELYGMAGAFRPKPYGMEYRVLSNFWLKNVDLMKKVYNITSSATRVLSSRDFNSRITVENYANNAAIHCINHNYKSYISRCLSASRHLGVRI